MLATHPDRTTTGHPLPTSLCACSDGALVAALLAGHHEAYAELFDRHAPAVVAAARAVLGRSAHAEDVAADVLFAFWRRPERFDVKRGSLTGFLRTQARGRSIDLLRSEGARTRRELHQRTEFSIAVGPDDEVLGAEASAEIRAAVSILPERERAAIELAFFRGLSYRDVAICLGEPEGTIKGRIRSGLGRLRASGHFSDLHPVTPASE